MNIKNFFFPTLVKDSTVALDYYIRILLFFFPLLLVWTFRGKLWLFCAMTYVMAVFYIFLLFRKYVVFQSHMWRQELLFIVIVVLLALRIVVRSLYGVLEIEGDVFLCGLVILYFLLRLFVRRHVYYLSLPVFAALILDVGILKTYFSAPLSILSVEDLLRHTEAVSSWLILVACIASGLYCVEENRKLAIFYFTAALIGYLMLFIYWDITAIYMTGVFLLFIPLVFKPTVFLVKRVLLLCFSYLLILSNIPLLQYIGAFHSNVHYTMKYSAYIDLLLSVAGVLVLRYWERIPKKSREKQIVMHGFQKWFIYALSIIGIFIAGCILMTVGMGNLSERFETSLLGAFSVALQKSLQTNQGSFMNLFEIYGIAGCFFWSLAVTVLGIGICRKWKITRGVGKIYLMLSVLFLAQSFFYKLQVFSTPLYVVILALSLTGETQDKGVAAEV